MSDGNGYGGLHLEDEEESGEGVEWEIDQDLETGEEDFEFCLVGCFLTATSINFQSMKTVFANLWHPLGGVTITDIGERDIYFNFIVKSIKQALLRGHHGPLIIIYLFLLSYPTGWIL